MRYSIALLFAVSIGLKNISTVDAAKINTQKKKKGKKAAFEPLQEIDADEDSEILKEMQDPKIDLEFSEFTFKFHKNLKSTNEKENRKKNYLSSKKKIAKFKELQNKTSTVDVNELADLDDVELH